MVVQSRIRCTSVIVFNRKTLPFLPNNLIYVLIRFVYAQNNIEPVLCVAVVFVFFYYSFFGVLSPGHFDVVWH